VQTFLPYADFERSARALDLKRLGKQRVEVIQIVRALTVPGYAWKSHPAVLMWQGYEEALGRYGLVMCDVWVERGFGDTCAATITEDLATYGISPIRTEQELREAGAMPPWNVEGGPVLKSHRSALVRKDPELYAPMFPEASPDVAYVWPVRSPNVIEAELRRAENALRREERRLVKLAEEAAKARRRRSAAAKRGAKTRAANQRASSPGPKGSETQS
jgi:pyrimidine dimer DNA glycosylase